MADKEFYHLTVSANKALNPMEAPLKTKHARSIIITTHRTKEAKSLWAVLLRQPLMENRFTAWKFCHLLHKVLREGHESVLKHSQTHKKMIMEMGKLWGHLQDGVGHCIQSYAKLLVTKLEFHAKNAIFPGTLTLAYRDVERFAGDDINVYFQLCVEIFDYLDDIIELQAKVFNAINTYRMSSMTPQGQCRLAPLITLIQDSNPLYDLSVRFMFKLHNDLPNDILAGHRDRFRDMFFKLKFFYDNVRPLQYFASLIQVPHLPETAPNFTSSVDFGSYVPPVVLVQPEMPEPEPPVVEETLVDTSSAEVEQRQNAMLAEQMHEATVASATLAMEHAIREKEFAIQELSAELHVTKDSYQAMEHNYRREVLQLRDEMAALSNELLCAKADAQMLKEEEARLADAVADKTVQEDDKLKASEEKFSKLKLLYTQLRDEHINLLRQQGDLNKQLNKEKADSVQLRSDVEEMQTRVQDLETLKVSEQETRHNEKCHLEEQLEQQASDNERLTGTIETLQQQLGALTTGKQSVDEHLMAKETLLQTTLAALEAHKAQVAQLERNGEEVQQQLTAQNEALQAEVAALVSAKDEAQSSCTTTSEALAQVDTQLLEHKARVLQLEAALQAEEQAKQQTSAAHATTLTALQADLEQKSNAASELAANVAQQTERLTLLQQQLSDAQLQCNEKASNVQRLSEEKSSLESEVQDLIQQNNTLEGTCQRLDAQREALTVAEREQKIKYESQMDALLHCVLKTMSGINEAELRASDQQYFERAFQHSDQMNALLLELGAVHQNYSTDKTAYAEALVRKSILLGNHFGLLHEQCNFICNNTTDIERGYEITTQMNGFHEPLTHLFNAAPDGTKHQEVLQYTAVMKTKLHEVQTLLRHVQKASNAVLDLGEMVESELLEMDKAIEEAAGRFVELLSHARSKDEGIKLEVNEKILDACTTLLACIQLLIKKSKILQEEIVSNGRGHTSVKEFYKRNSQWTEGLISASKSVARGANLLVDAADKAVTSESNNNFEIIVAAQEIAACTAQLVIASKVKAPRESQKLADLTKASRSVSQATGAVVATVKDCNQHLEQAIDVDVSKLTASQAKTMEMDIHVRVLELEQALQVERLKLSSFRRKHYQNSEV